MPVIPVSSKDNKKYDLFAPNISRAHAGLSIWGVFPAGPRVPKQQAVLHHGQQWQRDAD